MVVVVGNTAKLPPLEDVPSKLPPVAAVHQLIVNPEEEPFKFELVPQDIVEGEADTFTAFDGVPIFTVTDDLTGLTHGFMYDSA